MAGEVAASGARFPPVPVHCYFAEEEWEALLAAVAGSAAGVAKVTLCRYGAAASGRGAPPEQAAAAALSSMPEGEPWRVRRLIRLSDHDVAELFDD